MTARTAPRAVIPSMPPPTTSSNFSTRRIRFAPLPDPRAQQDETAEDDPETDDTKLVDSPVDAPASPGPSKPSPPEILPHAPTWPKPKPRSFSFSSFPFKPKVINLFRPFPFTSSSSPTPSPSTSSLDSPLPQNPSCPSSKKNNASKRSSLAIFTSSSDTAPSSTPAITSTPSRPLFFTRRTNSVTSLTTPSSPLYSSVRPSSARPASRNGPGIPMLNGRVYGGASKNRRRNKNVNHFANISDKEPEFVEWGYGGMGSVSGGRHAGVIGDHVNKGRPQWERLHGRAAGESVNDEDDDGGGMAWVKKRREQKEREQRERAEKAEKEKADQALSPPPDATAPVTGVVTGQPSDTVPNPPVDPPTAPSAAVVTDTSPLNADVKPEHDLTTVTLPALSPRHRRTNSHTEGVSLVSPGLPPSPPPRPSSEDSDSSFGEERDEEDEEEDEEQQKAVQRKTALGAGVEKISRHNS